MLASMSWLRDQFEDDGDDDRGHRRFLWLKYNNVAVLLNRKRRTYMAGTLRVGQTGVISVVELDSGGNPITPMQAFDAPPTWSIDDTTDFALTPAADGLSAGIALNGTPAVGTNGNISFSGMIGGKPFTATFIETVVAETVASVALTQVDTPPI